MRKYIWLVCLLTFFLSSTLYAADKAIMLNIAGPIGPATQDYVKRGIAYAQKEHAAVIILQMNTPGGLDTSMRGINEAIITSPIPVIAYVAPSGARAASAGTFIMYASHLAAMAPGTNIGAASPINMLAQEKNSKSMSASQQKMVNDASAYIRSLAQLRGRNANWAESSVREAASISAGEAKQLKVINEVTDDSSQLLQKADGQTVNVLGAATKLQTKNLEIKELALDWRYNFLSFLTNPSVAYILMLIAIYGLFFEFANPGLVLPGVVGIIALLLVLYSFQLLPISYAGLSLLLLGIVLMVMEIYVFSFGVLGIGGITAFILGSILLFDMQDPHYRLTWSLIISMSILSIAFFAMILTLVYRSHKKAIVTGKEGLMGKKGVVLSVMNQQIVVQIGGEIWAAQSAQPLSKGDKVRVIGLTGLTLIVEPTRTTQ